MKPVAYMAGSYRAYFTGEQKYIPLAVDVALVNMQWKDQIELFTGDQLRAAQVAILREAADFYEPPTMRGHEMFNHLRSMADELESTAQTPHNPDEADDTPRTPR